jgi:hypothetical protein
LIIEHWILNILAEECLIFNAQLTIRKYLGRKGSFLK